MAPEQNSSTDGSDRLFLSNGDQLAGIITSVDWEGFRVETPTGVVHLTHDRVLSASIVSVPLDYSNGLNARISLEDGTRLTATKLMTGDDGIVATVLGGRLQKIPFNVVVRIDVRNGRWHWLTDEQPMSVEHTPMLSVHWPFRINQNVLGGFLRVGGQRFERGIGVHSRSVLAFDLGGRYRELVTSYGIDDESGAMADVDVLIRIDGAIRHQRSAARRGQLVGPIRVDLKRAKRLELIVDFGHFGGVQDRFDWIEPALVR